jgi:hypothetical protein
MVQRGIVPGLEPTPRPGPDPFKEPMYAYLKGRLYPGPNENTFWLYVPEAPSVVTAPNLESAPVYSHPNRLYAYYVGIDGHTLWMVPQEGDPILWVINGENFLYLPPVTEND